MLERTRTVHPKTVNSQNELIDAMEQNETIIYVVGSYADEIKGKAKENKATRGFFGAGKAVGVAAAFIVNPLLGAAFFGLNSVLGASCEDFKNYKIEIEKSRIKLTKTKGKNAYRPKLDTIVG